MAEFSLSDTLRRLASRLDGVQEVLNGSNPGWPSSHGSLNTTVPVLHHPTNAALLSRLDGLTRQVEELQRNVSALRTTSVPPPILPLNPMHGIEVVPKREVVLPEGSSLSAADRLLLNRDAKRALEAEEMGASRDDEYPLGEDSEVEDTPLAKKLKSAMCAMDVEEAKGVSAGHAMEEEEAEVEVEVEEEAEEEEAEEEAEEAEAPDGPEDDAEELEEFEYKGNTFYRDSDNNVFMLDEDGDLVDEPIGTWSAEKNKIVMKRA